MSSKNHLVPLFILTAALLSSCAVQIKNERWYGDEGSQGAVWFDSLDSEMGQISKKDWDEMRVGMSCTTIDVMADRKKAIEDLCSVTNCSYDKPKEKQK